MNLVRAVLPTVAFGFLIPTYAMYLWPDLEARQSWLFVWQLFPIFMALIMFVFSYISPDTVASDKIRAPKRDLPLIRLIVGSTSFLAAVVWLWAWAAGPYSFVDVFIPQMLPMASPDLKTSTANFLRFDEIFVFGPQLVWLAYLFWDIKHAGMLSAGWLRLILYAVAGVFALGPGATLGLGWLWREHLIANRRHKFALTLESVVRLHGIATEPA
jgi:hypothetical protein